MPNIKDIIHIAATQGEEAALAAYEDAQGDDHEAELMMDRDCDDRRSPALGCGEYDTVDSRGEKLKNNGRTCNEAGEPWWM